MERLRMRAQDILVRPKQGVVERARAAGRDLRDIATVSAGLVAVTLVTFDRLRGSRTPGEPEDRRTEREKTLDSRMKSGKLEKDIRRASELHRGEIEADAAQLKAKQAQAAQQREARKQQQEAATRARAERAKEIAAQKKAAAAEAKKRKAEAAEQAARERLARRKR